MMAQSIAWLQAGGPLMYAVLLLGIVLLTLVCERCLTLYRNMQEQPSPDDLSRFLPFIAAITRILPLLGLLGTVSGIIATFQSMSISLQAVSLSRGIHQALRTTQLSLALAAIGLFAEKILLRRSQTLQHRLKMSAQHGP